MKVKFIKVLDDRSGETANGTWRDLQFLAETMDERPKRIALNSKGDAASKIKSMKEGDVFNVQYDIQSNESKKDGKWYTKVVVWKVVLEAGDPPTSSYTGAVANAKAKQDDDDLPF